MPKMATKAADNVFYRARIAAASWNDRLGSREGASEVTGIDRTRLANIELGTINPHPEEVLMLSDTYNAPELQNHFCSHLCPLGIGTISPIELEELERVTLQLISAMKSLPEVKDGMDDFEKKYQTAILYGSSKNATDAMRENLKGICDFEVRLPVDRAPRGRREEQLRMASNQGAEIAWLVMAATCHETFGYGRDRLARLKQNSMNNYKQYLEWEKEDKDLALDRLRRCVQDALKEDLRVTDTDDRKGMLSTPGRGPSVYETAAVYSEIFRRARAGRAVAPLAVYSAAKYDETMTAARKRASVMLGL